MAMRMSMLIKGGHYYVFRWERKMSRVGSERICWGIEFQIKESRCIGKRTAIGFGESYEEGETDGGDIEIADGVFQK